MCCTAAARPVLLMEGETKEDEKEVQTEELSMIASALANGYVKAKTSTNTSKAVYDSLVRRGVYASRGSQEDEEEDEGDDDLWRTAIPSPTADFSGGDEILPALST
jgi:hypothetical protein